MQNARARLASHYDTKANKTTADVTRRGTKAGSKTTWRRRSRSRKDPRGPGPRRGIGQGDWVLTGLGLWTRRRSRVGEEEVGGWRRGAARRLLLLDSNGGDVLPLFLSSRPSWSLPPSPQHERRRLRRLLSSARSAPTASSFSSSAPAPTSELPVSLAHLSLDGNAVGGKGHAQGWPRVPGRHAGYL